MINKLRQSLRNSKYLALILIVFGVGITLFFTIRSIRSYQQWQYLQAEGFEQGQARVEAIRPWMTLQYVSVAYGVPEEYMFDQLGIPYTRWNSRETLHDLNYEFGWQRSPNNKTPVIIDKVSQAIIAYRENPVATGLDDIRPWMTLHYIANSTGIPIEHLFEQLDISHNDTTPYKPVDQLAKEIRFAGGPARFMDTIKLVLTQYEVSP